MMDAILVLGAFNIDFITYADKFPVPGETLEGFKFETGLGGKAINTATQIALLLPKKDKNDVSLICKFGDDNFGLQCRSKLLDLGISPTGLLMAEQQMSGSASITVTKNGENSIIIVPGANSKLSTHDLKNEEILKLFKKSKILCLQNEISLELNESAIQLFLNSKENGKIIYNPSPYTEESTKLFKYCDYIIFNKNEAQEFVKKKFPDTQDDQEKFLYTMFYDIKSYQEPGQHKYEKCIIITNGQEPIQYVQSNQGNTPKIGLLKIKSIDQKLVIDTVGAGDSFCGAFAYFSALSYDLETALLCASIVAGESVQRHGSSISYSDREMLPNEIFHIIKTSPSSSV